MKKHDEVKDTKTTESEAGQEAGRVQNNSIA